MPRAMKFTIGLIAVLIMGWLYHGPMGHGAALVGALEGQAQAAVAKTEIPGVAVALGHDPLSRTATLTGQADPFQREGQGELKGLNQIVGEIEGIAGVQWASPPTSQATSVPLLAETLALILLAYLAGLAIAWLAFGRPEKHGYY